MLDKLNWVSARFVCSAPCLKDCISDGPLPEIALVGRSNVGKSSLINHLTGCKGLAKTSGTPGKTQAMNFFVIDDSLMLVDMPGYGFARVPLEVKERWNAEIDLYFRQRKSLRAVMLLMDVRRDPCLEDIACVHFCMHTNKPLLLVFTKVDTVKPREAGPLVEGCLEKLGNLSLPYVIHAKGDPIAKKMLITKIKGLWD